VPTPVDVTAPLEPGTFETMTGAGTAPEVASQVTSEVRSSVVRSVKTPVAFSWSPVPSGIVGSAGVTETELTTAAVTLNVAVVVTLVFGSIAWIVLVPTPFVLARPSLPAAFETDAVPLTTLQVTDDVMLRWDPSL
jgi:hypothetical protein